MMEIRYGGNCDIFRGGWVGPGVGKFCDTNCDTKAGGWVGLGNL